MNTEPEHSPIDIARQTLKQLALRKIPPTPDNFRQVYDEISGTHSEDASAGLLEALQRVLRSAGARKAKYLAAANQLNVLAEQRNWQGAESLLHNLFPATEVTASWSDVVRSLVRQLESSHKGLPPSKKKEGLERVLVNFESDPDLLAQKIQALVASWGKGALTEAGEDAGAVPAGEVPAKPAPGLVSPALIAPSFTWRDMLIQTLEMGVVSQLKHQPEIARKAQALLDQARQARSEEDVGKLAATLKSFWFTLEMSADAQHQLHARLLELLRLLVENLGELVIDDKWLYGQTAIIRDIIAQPLDIDVLYDAESSLKELIYKQGQLKYGLLEARETLKQMAASFVSRLAEIAENTGGYQQKIEEYQRQIGSTEDIVELNVILDKLMGDTRTMQLDVLRTHEQLKGEQLKVAEAEKRIRDLTSELDQISELAHKDFLTGALNRRGMVEALEREFSRSDRLGAVLCIAMMDIDHFKRLNDTLGHKVGDEALAHLSEITRAVLRPTDMLARYGGEEFLIILPETAGEEAVKVMTRLQRELTRKFFMHNNEKVLITFSAGVAQRQADEQADAVIKRADAALYLAKQAGRNRVLAAE